MIVLPSRVKIMNRLQAISINDFEAKVLNSPTPVVVLFDAPDCAACKALEPAIRKVRLRFAAEVEFVRVDVSKFSGFGRRYGVETLPTLGLFYDGALRDTLRATRRRNTWIEGMADPVLEVET